MTVADSQTRHAGSAENRARSIAGALAQLGARYDAAPVFPVESVKLLRDAGLLATFAPVEAGGDPFPDLQRAYACMMAVLRIVGRADLSVGRLYEGHVNALLLFAWFGTAAQHAILRQTLGQGALYGVWATEPPPGVHLLPAAKGWTLDGAKSFATGAGGLAHAIITAQPSEGSRRLVIAQADDPARADLSQWRVRGMRATGSGRYDLSGMAIAQDDLLGEAGDYDREPDFTTGAWRFTAVQLGGIEALLTETREAMTPPARADPLQRAKFADAVAATRTAYLWVRECALRAAARDIDGPAFARMTRGVVERAALDVMELASRIVGTRSAVDGERIDKIIRDLSLYLRQAGPDHAKDEAAIAWIDHDVWGDGDRLW
ncbi:acyl-CoA dehydrogenase family protein [Sphingobium sp. CR2-8]|uniref:acyl-CoA dehydrogenase family protein n=1 Tax=Sphingobium sp. CR2-8 TaxID=1306534 RepID=UPI002DB7AEEC|nr:acyl-CoA dehydrogenase family protein [Sphingobium sp. CR2-8]MEC3912434.1 acyl-CoA dehydrogenase family protein [Sphingobium sp. CR2-8]